MNRQRRQQLRLFVDRVLHDRYRILNELGQGGMGAEKPSFFYLMVKTPAAAPTLPLSNKRFSTHTLPSTQLALSLTVASPTGIAEEIY